ncbi:hypothetical protein DFH11DRAFT_1621138 [Phellopilus nigrolimitatus]|nr:hypothetical protein DFH11DRAFT_1621138 [Phellopilus nigrolimitatus]
MYVSVFLISYALSDPIVHLSVLTIALAYPPASIFLFQRSPSSHHTARAGAVVRRAASGCTLHACARGPRRMACSMIRTSAGSLRIRSRPARRATVRSRPQCGRGLHYRRARGIMCDNSGRALSAVGDADTNVEMDECLPLAPSLCRYGSRRVKSYRSAS